MRFGSLFTGIGGIDLGLERAGMECAWQVENDPFCTEVLARHWPDVPRWGDVRDVCLDHPTCLESVDLIAGGFPCQPVSLAGRQAGQADERWLWPQFARIVRILRPRYVLVENVPGLLTAQQGRAAQEVFGDLAQLGYDADWASVPAAAVGAPHLRYRVFIVAHSGGQQLRHESGWRRGPGWESPPFIGDDGAARTVADPDLEGSPEAVSAWMAREARERASDGRGAELADADSEARVGPWRAGETVFGSGPLVRPGRRGGSGGDHWATEPSVGRVAHGVPRRVDRLRALGNAVVPQQAQWVGEQIMEWEARRGA